jgi:hypothetical protein
MARDAQARNLSTGWSLALSANPSARSVMVVATRQSVSALALATAFLSGRHAMEASGCISARPHHREESQ